MRWLPSAQKVMSTRQVPYWRSHSLVASSLASSRVTPGAAFHLLRSVAISASAQHSFFETTASTRQPPGPRRRAQRLSAPASASSRLPSLTRAKTPPFFSTITPQHASLPHSDGGGGRACVLVAVLMWVRGFSQWLGAS